VVTATVDIVQWYCVVLEIIVVTATVDIVQCYCVLCVCSLLLLQQQYV